MSDLKFSCPICSQHIACDVQWAGQQIQCPGCQTDIIVPDPRPQPVAVAPIRVTVAPAPPAPEAPPIPRPVPVAVAPPPAPSGSKRPAFPLDDEDEPRSIGKYIGIAAAVILVPLALYFAFSWATATQKKVNVARERDREESGGGQVGHIAELNSVLAATDPNRKWDDDEKPDRVTPLPMETPRLNPPQWTLEVASSRIPSGNANGSIAGAAFVADRAYLQRIPNGYVLTIRQGEAFQADREVMVYLPLKAGQKLDGNSWTIGKAETNSVPRVAKRWMESGRQQTKFFTNGYAMKLEFGQTTDGELPARIFLALPDPEKTVVGGSVTASFLVAGSPRPRPVGRFESDDY